MLDTWFNRTGSATDRFLNGAAQAFIDRGVRAEMLTYAAVAIGVLSAGLFYCGFGPLAFGLLLLSGFLDAVDGRVARLGEGATPWGGVLDLTFDRVVEAAVLLGITVPRPELHVPGLVLAATWYVNLCVFLAVGTATEKHGEKIIDYPPGVLERGEALVFAFIVVVLPATAALAAYLYAVLEVVTAAQRFAHGRRALS
jgi:phosphatidylglycerophosphate synthase